MLGICVTRLLPLCSAVLTPSRLFGRIVCSEEGRYRSSENEVAESPTLARDSLTVELEVSMLYGELCDPYFSSLTFHSDGNHEDVAL
jgi:hypothetical protein